MSQLNLYNEGLKLLKFQKNFKQTWPSKNNIQLYFPTPYLNLSSTDVLIETFEEGMTLSDFLKYREIEMEMEEMEEEKEEMEEKEEKNMRQKKEKKDKRKKIEAKISEIGAKSFFEMILVHNFIHSDLHPGNILITSIQHGGGYQNIMVQEFVPCICFLVLCLYICIYYTIKSYILFIYSSGNYFFIFFFFFFLFLFFFFILYCI